MINNSYKPAVNRTVSKAGKASNKSNLAQAIDARKAATNTAFPDETSNSPATSTKPVESTANPFSSILELDSENMLRGIILSEVLGRPRCKRKGRW